MSDDTGRRLAEALAELILSTLYANNPLYRDDAADEAAALAPVVDELARQRAADELDALSVELAEAAHRIGRGSYRQSSTLVWKRAAALRGEAGT